MTYIPHLIANYATGLEKRLQPWLNPDDSQEQLFDGYVYRGTMSKREGYKYFAIGERGGAPYRESRIVHTLVNIPMVGLINSINTTFTLAGNGQIARGSVTVTGTIPAQSVTDDGLGGFTGDGTGTVDYITGSISVTFNTAPTGGTVTVNYSFMPGNPVMMIANFITASNVKQLIVADTRYVNRYNATLNILEDLPIAVPYTGTKFDFFTWVNYEDSASVPRLLFCNNIDVIQQYDGTSVTDYDYTLTGVTTLTTSFMAQMKDRLILLRTTENGTIFPKRIRISGTGINSDVFDTSATGAGFIDIPDGTWIQGASFNRDDLIIFTEASVWVLKYTGNDTTPFVLNKIDESRGSNATFSAITYLNRTTAASPRGLIITDGYRVERQDESIPDFSYNEVDGDNFRLCFAGSVDADRDHYLIYPPSDSIISERILTTNYDEDNFSIYRLPLSCMGTFISSFTITWNDLNAPVYPNWSALSNQFGNWNAFSYNSGAPFSLGGGHKGEIWSLAVTEEEDNPVMIRNITVIDDSTIEVTTDWNNYSLNDNDQEKGIDYIFLTGIEGMLEINDQQFPIIRPFISENVFRLDVSTAVVPATSFTPYTSGGQAVRVIPFSALFKKFNPFIDQDRKVRCGWLYMYVNTTGTDLKRNIIIDNATQSNPCIITTEVAHDLSNGQTVSIFGVNGMIELNDVQASVNVLTPDSFELNGIDSIAFTPYTSGGFVSAPVKAKMNIDIITNDDVDPTQLSYLTDQPYQGNCTNMTFDDATKKWYKVFINQTGKFIQFKLSNRQAGAQINIQATMPGFAPVGRII